MSGHVPCDELSTLALGVLPSGRVKTLLPHLLKCGACFTALIATVKRFEEARLKQLRESSYDTAIDRAFQRAQQAAQQIRVERTRTSILVKQLELGGPDALKDAPRKGWEIPTVEAFLERSWALRETSPLQMTEFLEFAELATRRLSAEVHGRTRVADLRFRVWTELGNALRITDRLDEAEEAFCRALEHYPQSTRDRLLLARFLTLRASLHRSKRELMAAHQYHFQAYTIYRRHKQKHMAGQALISMAIAVGYDGKPERAIQYIQRGLSMIDQEKDPRLAALAIHNRLWFLVESGRFEEARTALFSNRFRYLEAERLTLLKLQWLEAKMDLGLGRLERAEARLRQVKTEFEENELLYDSALASLDLADVVLLGDRTQEAHDLFFGAIETLISLGLQRGRQRTLTP